MPTPIGTVSTRWAEQHADITRPPTMLSQPASGVSLGERVAQSRQTNVVVACWTETYLRPAGGSVG